MAKVASVLLSVLLLTTPTASGKEQHHRKHKCDNRPSICLLKKYWKAEHSQGQAINVADCESNFNERDRREGSQFTGLFQIGVEIHAQRIKDNGYTEEDMYDAGKNTVVALDLWKESGWGPWECKP